MSRDINPQAYDLRPSNHERIIAAETGGGGTGATQKMTFVFPPENFSLFFQRACF